MSPNDSAGVVVAARKGRWRQRRMRLALGPKGVGVAGCFRNRIQTSGSRAQEVLLPGIAWEGPWRHDL